MKLLILILLVVSLGEKLTAQSLADFELPDAVTGNNVTLKSLSPKEVVVIIFYSNTCPFDAYYSGRITSLSKTFADRTTFILVNAHAEIEESLDAMKRFAQQNNIQVPYLADKNQKLMNNLGARKSPESFVLKKSAGAYKVQYHGALDDNPQAEGSVTQTYLKDAINQALTGSALEVKETRPVGCSIKKAGM